MAANTPTLLGSAEAATILGIAQTSIGRLVKRGALEAAVKMPGRTGAYLFTLEEIERHRKAAEEFTPEAAPDYDEVTA